MNSLACPRCGQVDQVQSVQSIYNSQSGVTHSWEHAVGGVESHGVLTSNLALLLSPPPAPRHRSAMGCDTAFALIVSISLGLFCIGVGVDQGAPVLVVGGIGLLCVSPFVISHTNRRSRELKREYEQYAAVWPAMMQVWQESIACLRCHGVFFSPNLPIRERGAVQPIPIDAFHAAVTDIGSRLVRAFPEPPDHRQPLERGD